MDNRELAKNWLAERDGKEGQALKDVDEKWEAAYFGHFERDGRDAEAVALKVAEASQAQTEAEAFAILAEVLGPPGPAFYSPADALQQPQPKPLIQPQDGRGTLLSAGEVMVLSGAGGAGKSTLACQLAAAAASGGDNVAGLKVQAGKVALLSYEDRPWRVARRLERVGCKEEDAENIRIIEADGWPLFGHSDDESIHQQPHKLACWSYVWGELKAFKPSLVVIDPALCAYNGEDSRVSAVRSFLDALRSEAAPIETGIILVAHTTKAARKDDDDTGAVAGSAAWTDAARSALLLKQITPKTEPQTWTLKSIKTNYAEPFKVELDADAAKDAEGGLKGFTKAPDGKAQGVETNV